MVRFMLDPSAIEKRYDKNQPWLEVALPTMKSLHSFVAGSGFVITAFDKEGVLLEVLGDAEVIQAARRGNFVRGADWSERSGGTNAVGTALLTGQPLQVFGREHYCSGAHRWTGSAALIYDPDGNLVGGLNLSGYIDRVHLHTLGMVVAGADAIERQLAMERAWQERDMSNRLREAIMESISDGILAVDCKLRVIQMNREAGRLLDIKPSISLGRSIEDVIYGMGAILLPIVKGEQQVTDQEFDITTPLRKMKVTITSRPIFGKAGESQGVVLIVNEIARARKLAQRLSGAVAKVAFEDLVGDDPEFKRSLMLARAAAASDSTVLLLGESGTGKDVLAQAIHNASDRAKGPFVAINCGAIPRDLIGSELFGYTEGSFTGARKGGSPGKFELADSGTIFLDEIADMPPELQTALLRVLEQKTITRIGASAVVPVNVRVIAATNKDLSVEIEHNKFRRDLFYRLNVMTIRLAPLRQRLGDMELLLRHFLDQMGKRMGKEIRGVHEDVLQIMRGYNWPGNVRELQNMVERVLHLANGPELLPEHLPEEMMWVEERSNFEDGLSVSGYEMKRIASLLEEYRGNLTKVANEMGMARTTLYRKINRYGLRPG
jgi:transcriptional regulator of acetoin/glycerol metabolism